MDQNHEGVLNQSAKKFVRKLLAATCLTVASVGLAQAGPFSESSVPGGDFSNTFAGANELPLLTDSVSGSVANDGDYFKFLNLVPLQAFTLNFVQFPVEFHAYSSSGVQFSQSENSFVTGVVPADGILIASALNAEQAEQGYSLTLVADYAGVPEPATAALAGLGLAVGGAAAWWRKRKAI